MNERLFQLLAQNKRQVLLIIGGAVLIIALILFVTGNTFLTISGKGSEKKTVRIKDDSGYLKEIELEDKSKTLFLPRGTYQIDAQNGERLSAYTKSLGLFKDKISVELINQQGSVSLGKSDLPCSWQKDGQPLFYSCSPSSSGKISRASTDGDSSQSEDGDDPDQEAQEDSSASDKPLVLKPYADNFLEAKLENETIQIRERGINGYVPSSHQATVNNFKGELDDGTLSVSRDGNVFSLYDTSARSLKVFEGISDKSPHDIKVPEEYAQNKYFDQTIVAGSDFTYLYNYLTASHVEDNDDVKDLPDQSILVYKNDSGGSVEPVIQHKLEEDWKIRSFAYGPKNKSLFLLGGDEHTGKIHIVDGDKPPEAVNTLIETVRDACWKDADSIYFIDEQGKNIYLYSLSKKASYRVYSGLEGEVAISGLNCTEYSTTFTLESDEDGVISETLHYALTDGPHTGTRPESVLPIYFDIELNAFKVSLEGKQIKVGLLYDAGNGVKAQKDKIRLIAGEHLTELGVKRDPAELIFDF